MPRTFAQFGKFFAQGCVRLHRPFAKAAEQAVLHLGRGGLGIGEAEDVLGFHPAQQQAGDAVGQHTGLARSGIGGQPGGEGGFRGLHLPFRGGFVMAYPPTGWGRGCEWYPIRHGARGGHSRLRTVPSAPRGGRYSPRLRGCNGR
jgi:hypothetical protein